MTQELDRRLVAVAFTDMVGYTTFVQADERQAVAKLDRYWRAVDSHIIRPSAGPSFSGSAMAA